MADDRSPPGSCIAHVVCRVAHGVANHFGLRVSVWFVASVMLSFGVTLLIWPQLLCTSRYHMLLRIAPVGVWSYVCLLIGVGRIAALTVNGTFPKFRWSPHFRAAMATMSCFIWFQIVLGLVVSNEPTAMVAVFPQLFLFDMYNLYLAASEAGAAEMQRHHDGS